MEIIGLIGSLAFAIVSLPIVIESLKKKTSKNISNGYLILTLIGNICTFSYVIYTSIITGIFLFPLYVNYTCALIIAFILVFLKWKMKD